VPATASAATRPRHELFVIRLVMSAGSRHILALTRAFGPPRDEPGGRRRRRRCRARTGDGA
jgi:hypothetical protein